MKRLSLLSSLLALGVSPLAAEVKLSEKLTRIAGHLGEGGVHFSVTDAQEDLRDLSQLGDTIIANLPYMDLPPNFKVEQLFSDLGLFSFQGRGSSSHQIGNFWHNRSFILTDGKHEGIFSLLGEASQEPISRDFAPAGADLVLETTVDLREVERTSRKIAKAFGSEADSQVTAAFAEEVTDLGMSMADLFVDFTVRGTIVLWLDEEKTFEIDQGVSVPVPHLAARMENAGTVWTILKSQIEGDSTIVEKNGEVIVIPDSDPLPTPFGEVLPVIVWNPRSKQLFMALTEEDLAVCRGDGPRLAASDSFKNATVRFPEKVSSLAYVSGDIFRLAEVLTKQFLPQAPPEGQAIIKEVLPSLGKLGTDGGYAAAIAVEEDGYLSVGNFPFPVKGDSSMMGLGGVSLLATLSGIATPAILKAKKAGDKAEVTSNLKQLALLMIVYETENGRYPSSLAELEAAGEAPELFITGAFDEVKLVPQKEVSPSSAAIIAYQELPGLESVLVVYADGSVQSLPEVDFERALLKQEGR